MGFLNDKSAGDKAENLLISKIKQYFPDAETSSPANENKYDFDVKMNLPHMSMTFEVKNDVMAAKTGNIALEHFNSKKQELSGIHRTKAQYWVHGLSTNGELQLYISSVANIIEFTINNKPFKNIKSGGDGNSDMFIYKKDDIMGIFVTIDEFLEELSK